MYGHNPVNLDQHSVICENRSLIVIGNNLLSPSSVFSIKIVGFVKISSYCNLPQCAHSFAFFALSNISSGIRFWDIMVYAALRDLISKNFCKSSSEILILEQDLHVA